MPRAAALLCGAVAVAVLCGILMRPGAARSRSLCTAGMAFVPGGTHVFGSSAQQLQYILKLCNRSLGGCYPEWFDGEFRGHRKAATQPVCVDRFEYPNEPGVMPRVSTNWAQAQGLCEAQGKRLCMDVEWELACAGDAGNPWAFGNKYSQGLCNINTTKLEPIGQRNTCVSQYGVYDLSGNAAEWTLSTLANSAPMAPDARTPRVVKGGAHWDTPLFTRCAFREAYKPDVNYDFIGFRCCSGVN